MSAALARVPHASVRLPRATGAPAPRVAAAAAPRVARCAAAHRVALAGTACARRGVAAAVRRRAPLPPCAAAPAATAPAPGSVAGDSSFDWRASWWPVAFVRDLDPAVPTPFTLLGEALALWRDGDGNWLAYADKCPHRLAPLTEGRVNEDGQLECGYHGWAFAGAAGECAVIPQDATGAAKTAKRACVASYPTVVAQGILFVYPTQLAPGVPLPPLRSTVPELDDPAFVCIDIARDLPYSHATLLENTLDVSHVPFVHHLTVSNRANAGPVDLEVLPPGVSAAGFDGLWAEGPRRGKLGPQATRFVAPSLMYHSLSAPSLGTTLTVVYATPSAPGRVRLLARFPFKFNAALPRLVIKHAPRWLQHVGQNGVLEDDQIILHAQERFLETAEAAGQTYAQACYLPAKADAYVVAFRDWLARFAGGGPTWPAGVRPELPPAVETREALLDRYNSHTRNCTACMAALRGVRTARAVAAAVGALAALAAAGAGAAAVALAATAPASGLLRAAAMAAGGALLALAAWVRLGALERGFIVGAYPPPRNKPTKRKLITRGPKNSGKDIKLV